MRKRKKFSEYFMEPLHFNLHAESVTCHKMALNNFQTLRLRCCPTKGGGSEWSMCAGDYWVNVLCVVQIDMKSSVVETETVVLVFEGPLWWDESGDTSWGEEDLIIGKDEHPKNVGRTEDAYDFWLSDSRGCKLICQTQIRAEVKMIVHLYQCNQSM